MIKFGGMKTKQDIVQNWLPRYTGEQLESFGKFILLTNFSNYVRMFSEWTGSAITGIDKPMQCCTAEGITIINFGMGSPTAATVMDLLTAIEPQAVLFLGKCGGLKKRFDILVYDNNHKPWMLVECKEPGVILSENVLQQVLRYNMKVPVQYTVITNGNHTIAWIKNNAQLDLLTELPRWI